MFHVPITCKYQYTFIKPSILQSTAFFLVPSTRQTRTNKRNTQVGGPGVGRVVALELMACMDGLQLAVHGKKKKGNDQEECFGSN